MGSAVNVNYRPAPDAVLVDIAEYVLGGTKFSAEAYETARNCLMDTIGCGLLALRFPECVKHLGPIVPGAELRGGAVDVPVHLGDQVARLGAAAGARQESGEPRHGFQPRKSLDGRPIGFLGLDLFPEPFVGAGIGESGLRRAAAVAIRLEPSEHRQGLVEAA